MTRYRLELKASNDLWVHEQHRMTINDKEMTVKLIHAQYIFAASLVVKMGAILWVKVIHIRKLASLEN